MWFLLSQLNKPTPSNLLFLLPALPQITCLHAVQSAESVIKNKFSQADTSTFLKSSTSSEYREMEIAENSGGENMHFEESKRTGSLFWIYHHSCVYLLFSSCIHIFIQQNTSWPSAACTILEPGNILLNETDLAFSLKEITGCLLSWVSFKHLFHFSSLKWGKIISAHTIIEHNWEIQGIHKYL